MRFWLLLSQYVLIGQRWSRPVHRGGSKLLIASILTMAVGCTSSPDSSGEAITPKWIDGQRNLLLAGPSAERERLLQLLERRLRLGSPDEKELILWRIYDYKVTDLLPAAIESLTDATVAPFHGDTGWGWTYRQAGFVIGQLAYLMDNKITHEELWSPSYRSLMGADDYRPRPPAQLEKLKIHWQKWWVDFNVRRIPVDRAIGLAHAAARSDGSGSVQIEETKQLWVVTLYKDGQPIPHGEWAVVKLNKQSGAVVAVSLSSDS